MQTPQDLHQVVVYAGLVLDHRLRYLDRPNIKTALEERQVPATKFVFQAQFFRTKMRGTSWCAYLYCFVIEAAMQRVSFLYTADKKDIESEKSSAKFAHR